MYKEENIQLNIQFKKFQQLLKQKQIIINNLLDEQSEQNHVFKKLMTGKPTSNTSIGDSNLKQDYAKIKIKLKKLVTELQKTMTENHTCIDTNNALRAELRRFQHMEKDNDRNKKISCVTVGIQTDDISKSKIKARTPLSVKKKETSRNDKKIADLRVRGIRNYNDQDD